jgi:hypothetical protein
MHKYPFIRGGILYGFDVSIYRRPNSIQNKINQSIYFYFCFILGQPGQGVEVLHPYPIA